jgi:hypothetical protein
MSHYEERAFMNEEMARDIDDPLQDAAAEISALKEKLNEATTLLTDALGILESPVYRDSAGARPSIHPRVIDIRDFLENANG